MLIKQTGAGLGYQIPYSLLMDGGAHYLSRTPGSSGNRRKFTLHYRIRRWGGLGTAQTFAAAGASDANTTDTIGFDTSDRLEILFYRSGISYKLTTARVFRDLLKFYEITVEVDSAQATASNRLKLYVNGVLETAFSTATYGAQNFDCAFFHTNLHTIGRTDYTPAQYASVYVAEAYYVGGQTVGALAFLRFNSLTGQYEPRQYNPAMATNNCRLRFRDAASTTTLGYDDSGNGNHWTLTGMATTDRVTENPANTYPIFNALQFRGTGSSISEGGRRFTSGGTGGPPYNYSLIGAHAIPRTGKWAWRVRLVSRSNTSAWAGILKATALLDGRDQTASGNEYQHADNGTTYAKGVSASSGVTLAVGDAWVFAFDPASGKLWVGKQAGGAGSIAWIGGGDPVAGTSPTFSSVDIADYFPHVTAGSSTTLATWELDFGAVGFTLPTGFKTLGSQNLPVPTYKRGSHGFNADKQLGSAIEASVAALRTGWAAYIEEFKNLSNSQSWKVRYSDNTAKMLGYDSSFTTGKVDFTAPTGGDQYIGYVTRVGAPFGVFTAEVLHTSGVTTIVAHGLGSARKAAEARRTDADGPWYYSHPDLTSGKLLYLDSTAGETTDASISVDGTNVTLASALPSGTYRVTVRAEVTGLRKFGKAKGNGSADGWLAWSAGRPLRLRLKRGDATGDFHVHDQLRPGYNAVSTLDFNLPAAETANAAVDLVAAGVKIRNSSTSWNTANGDYFWEAELWSDFKYANAA